MVATVREPPSLVIGFACHHLAIGARRVHLFFDVPHDPAAALCETIPGVVVTRCDGAHWTRLGHRNPPPLQTTRQTLNANLVMAYGDDPADFLLHADADEYLWHPEDFALDLAAVPDSADWVHVANYERCWEGPVTGGMFDGVFREPIHDLPGFDVRVYGKRANALSAGMGGHSAGKAAARPGVGFLAIHRVKVAQGEGDLPMWEAPRARMLHFDGMTPRHWGLKNLRYAVQGVAMTKLLNRQRMATIGAILQAGDPEKAAVRVHEALFCLKPDEARLLEEAGRLHRIAIDIPGAVAKVAPHLTPDFSVSGFDRVHAAELSVRSQDIVRQKRRATKG